MILSWSDIDVQDNARFRTATVFLKGRLSEPETIDWALRLEPDRQIERAAVFSLLVGTDAPQLREPYATAWPLILESWSCPQTRTFSGYQSFSKSAGSCDGETVPATSSTQLPTLWPRVSNCIPCKPVPGCLPASLDARGSWETCFLQMLTSVKFVFDFRRHSSGLGFEDVPMPPFSMPWQAR